MLGHHARVIDLDRYVGWLAHDLVGTALHGTVHLTGRIVSVHPAADGLATVHLADTQPVLVDLWRADSQPSTVYVTP